MAKTPAWQRKEGKDPKGGLNAKGRASAKKQGMNLKPPCSEPEEQKGRGPQEKLLRANGRDARTNEGRERSSDSKSSSLEEMEMLTWETLT
jgi:hypothetical protein